MILIWDNGQAYSDHTIYFVSCGALSADDVVSFAKLGFYGHGYEIARAEELDWRDEVAMGAPKVLAHADGLFDDYDDLDVSGITTPALEYLINTFPRISIRLHEELERRTT